MNINPSKTIYVGNVQSITDDELREYFQRFGEVEALFHSCVNTVDLWLIDYRFISFSLDTDINLFLTNKVDHIIGRIRLDIHSYDTAFNDDVRLVLDRKLCIAHTNPKLDRNIIKKVDFELFRLRGHFRFNSKVFTRYGRILNCVCVSSGNEVEYVYIEFDSINSIRSIISSNQKHFAGRTPLIVKQPFRPSQVETKYKCNQTSTKMNNCKSIDDNKTYTYCYSGSNPYLSSNSYESQDESLSTSLQTISQQQLKDLEQEYDLIIRKDFDEVTYQIEKYALKQQQTYERLHRHVTPIVSP